MDFKKAEGSVEDELKGCTTTENETTNGSSNSNHGSSNVTIEDKAVKEGKITRYPGGHHKKYVGGIDFEKLTRRRRSSFSPVMQAVNMNIYKNLIIASLGMMGIMSAYDMVRYVESSLNKGGLGTASLAADYGTLIICVLFLATILMRRLGCKWTIVFAMLCFTVYFATHYYPAYFTLIPGGMFIGVGIGLVQTSTNTYITMLAFEYSDTFKMDSQKVINQFFGIFHLITFLARIWGNLTSSLLLTPLRQIENNGTTVEDKVCGKLFLPSAHKEHLMPDNQSVVAMDDNISSSTEAYALYGSAIMVAVATAILIAIFLDDRREENETNDTKGGKCSTVFYRALAALKLIKEPHMFMLIPLTVTFGLVEAYMSGDYTAAFVTCSIGIHNVGYVIICYGLAASLFSYIWGWAANNIGRIAVVIIGASLDVAAIIVMLIWIPTQNEVSVIYIIAGVWGIADAVWRTQIYSFYGIIFSDRKEPGFANLEVWMAVGLVLGYVWHEYLTIEEKLIVLLVMLIIGVVGYLTVELFIWTSKKKEAAENNSNSATEPANNEFNLENGIQSKTKGKRSDGEDENTTAIELTTTKH